MKKINYLILVGLILISSSVSEGGLVLDDSCSYNVPASCTSCPLECSACTLCSNSMNYYIQWSGCKSYMTAFCTTSKSWTETINTSGCAYIPPGGYGEFSEKIYSYGSVTSGSVCVNGSTQYYQTWDVRVYDDWDVRDNGVLEHIFISEKIGSALPITSSMVSGGEQSWQTGGSQTCTVTAALEFVDKLATIIGTKFTISVSNSSTNSWSHTVSHNFSGSTAGEYFGVFTSQEIEAKPIKFRAIDCSATPSQTLTETYAYQINAPGKITQEAASPTALDALELNPAGISVADVEGQVRFWN